MKLLLFRAGLLTCLLLGLFYEETSAQSEWSSNCSSFGEIKQNENPDFQHINCLLTNAALEADIPPEVVKAVARKESDWRQFMAKDEPYISSDGGIGIMQVTDIPKGLTDEEKSRYVDKLSNDITFNIDEGVKILNKKFDYPMPKIKGAGRHEIENWYFPVMAYNGTKAVNSPVHQRNGETNKEAYQEIVFTNIENDSFLNGTKLAKFPFSTEYFSYDSNNNINFLQREYTLTDSLHVSNYILKPGDKVVVTGGAGNLRAQPATVGNENNIAPKNTILIITENFSYDERVESKNQFVWFPVKTTDGKSFGYISSAYIQKIDSTSIPPVDGNDDVTAPIVPTVNAVYDNSTVISGKAESNAKVYAMMGIKKIGETTAKNGAYTIKITKQKAGTSISVYAVDLAGNKSENKLVTVIDKTAPTTLTVNKVSDKTTSVAGKTEAKATVEVKLGNKLLGKATAVSKGNYKVKIKAQKKGTKLTVIAKDKAGNAKKVTVTVK